MKFKEMINYFLERKQITMGLFSLLVGLLCFITFAFKALKYPGIITPSPREKIIINFDVLDDAEFQGLKVFEGSALPEQKGRINPFIMYRLDAVEIEVEKPVLEE